MAFSEPASVEQPAPAAPTRNIQPERREDGTLVFNVLAKQRCEDATGDEIVVCASDPEQYRVHELPPEQRFQPEVEIAPGVELGSHIVRSGNWLDPPELSNSPAAVVNVRIKF